MKLRFLAALALLLTPVALAQSLTGTLEGSPPAETRLSGWVVKSSGQPVTELLSVPLSGGGFKLTLPSTAPAEQGQSPVDNRLTWPGLVDFEKASAPARAAEMKFFVYRDTNGNGTHDDNEPLKEVQLSAGKSFVFVVWVSNDVTVTGSNGYQAALKKGWNALTVDVRSSVSVKPVDAKTAIQINLGR